MVQRNLVLALRVVASPHSWLNSQLDLQGSKGLSPSLLHSLVTRPVTQLLLCSIIILSFVDSLDLHSQEFVIHIRIDKVVFLKE